MDRLSQVLRPVGYAGSCEAKRSQDRELGPRVHSADDDATVFYVDLEEAPDRILHEGFEPRPRGDDAPHEPFMSLSDAGVRRLVSMQENGDRWLFA